jgi:hypothetical protein
MKFFKKYFMGYFVLKKTDKIIIKKIKFASTMHSISS